MFKPNIAILKKMDGALEVLSLSEDADVVLAAARKCTTPGEVATFVRPMADKRRKIEGSAAPKAVKKKVATKDL